MSTLLFQCDYTFFQEEGSILSDQEIKLSTMKEVLYILLVYLKNVIFCVTSSQEMF